MRVERVDLSDVSRHKLPTRWKGKKEKKKEGRMKERKNEGGKKERVKGERKKE
jgi:hypothetical protein